MNFTDKMIGDAKDFFVKASHKLESLVSADEKFLENIKTDLSDYMDASEKMLIDLVNGIKPGEDAVGSFDHGVSRFILKHTVEEIIKRNLLKDEDRSKFDSLIQALDLQKTRITPEIWDKLEKRARETGGYVTGNGSIFGLNKYELLDPDWAIAFVYNTLLEWKIITKTKFVKHKKEIPVSSDSVKVAVVGDWGTGRYKNADGIEPSTLVMESIAAHNPDYTIHLGDTYYSGTSKSDLIASSEEIDNLVNVWPIAPRKSLTLNSNHEMYCGAQGIFNDALKGNKFPLQEGASYFALVHDKWVILGLDSAYYDPSFMFMDGALIDHDQLGFIKDLDLGDRKVIIMTHHNGLKPPGKKRMKLWSDVNKALGGKDPDFWYWGHIHNIIAYTKEANVRNTIARCVGHGATPYSKGSDFYHKEGGKEVNNKEIAYFGGHDLPDPDICDVELASNGYAILNITAESLTESFYDQNGKPVWVTSTHKF